MALDLHEWAPAAYAALLTTLLVSAATAVEAQAPDTTWRVSEITAPPSLARVDTVTGQSCDGAWPVCMPPPDGVAAGMVLVDDEVGGHEACAPVTNGSEVDGNIAVIARGTCEFGLKATNAQAAGAIAFVIYNHDQNPMETDSTFIFMGGAGTMSTIPGVFWARYIRNALLPSLEAGVPIEGRLDRVCRPEPCTVDLEPLPITESTVYAARPKPFTTTTEFGVQLVRTQHVTVEVFDTLGRRVALLHDGPLAAGPVHVFTLGAGRLPAGVYLYRVTGEDFVEATPSFSLAESGVGGARWRSTVAPRRKCRVVRRAVTPAAGPRQATHSPLHHYARHPRAGGDPDTGARRRSGFPLSRE